MFNPPAFSNLPENDVNFNFQHFQHKLKQAVTHNEYDICIGNSMVSSAIWKKTCTSEFFKDDRNCTSPKDEKNSQVYVFPNCTRKHTITY